MIKNMERTTFQEQPIKKIEKKERPTAITVVCVLGFIGAAITIPLIFSDFADIVGSWYPPYLAFSGIMGLACVIGLWNMKKWAAYAYAAFVGINQMVLLAMGVWSIMALLPLIVVGISFKHLPKMD